MRGRLIASLFVSTAVLLALPATAETGSKEPVRVTLLDEPVPDAWFRVLVQVADATGDGGTGNIRLTAPAAAQVRSNGTAYVLGPPSTYNSMVFGVRATVSGFWSLDVGTDHGNATAWIRSLPNASAWGTTAAQALAGAHGTVRMAARPVAGGAVALDASLAAGPTWVENVTLLLAVHPMDAADGATFEAVAARSVEGTANVPGPGAGAKVVIALGWLRANFSLAEGGTRWATAGPLDCTAVRLTTGASGDVLAAPQPCEDQELVAPPGGWQEPAAGLAIEPEVARALTATAATTGPARETGRGGSIWGQGGEPSEETAAPPLASIVAVLAAVILVFRRR